MEILSWTIFRQSPARSATMLDTDTLPRVVELEPFIEMEELRSGRQTVVLSQFVARASIQSNPGQTQSQQPSPYYSIRDHGGQTQSKCSLTQVSAFMSFLKSPHLGWSDR